MNEVDGDIYSFSYVGNHWEEKCPEVSERETSLNQLFFVAVCLSKICFFTRFFMFNICCLNRA